MGSKTSKASGTRITGLRSRLKPIGLVLFTKTASLVVFLVACYIIVFFSAIRVVPVILGFVKDGSGITMSMPVETILSVWIAPSLFLIAILFALVIVVIRKLWRLRRRLIEQVSGWAFGRETDVAAPVSLKAASSRRKTKTA